MPIFRKRGVKVANRIKGITVEIGEDTTGLDKALIGVNSQNLNPAHQKETSTEPQAQSTQKNEKKPEEKKEGKDKSLDRSNEGNFQNEKNREPEKNLRRTYKEPIMW